MFSRSRRVALAALALLVLLVSCKRAPVVAADASAPISAYVSAVTDMPSDAGVSYRGSTPFAFPMVPPDGSIGDLCSVAGSTTPSVCSLSHADASALPYAPDAAANWSPAPIGVWGALDQLATRGGASSSPYTPIASGNWPQGPPTTVASGLDQIASGASSATHELVFRSGGVAGGNVFTTWASLMAAKNGLSGTVFFYIDDTLAAAHATTGAWNIEGVIFRSRRGSSGAPVLHIDEGATFTCSRLEVLDSVIVQNEATATVPFVTSASVNPALRVHSDNAATFDSTTSIPLFQASTGGSITFLTFNTAFGDAVHPVMTADSGTSISLFVFSNTSFNAHAAAGLGTVNLNFDSTVTFSPTQDSGAFTKTLKSQASQDAYIPATSANWPTPAPALVSTALDDVAAKLTSNSLNVQSDCGAKGDGTTDDTTSIQTCTNTLAASGGGTLIFPLPSVTYKITAAISNTTGGMYFVGTACPGTISHPYITQYTYGAAIITNSGSGITVECLSWQYGPTTTLSAPASAGASSVTVASATGLTIGDWVLLDQWGPLQESTTFEPQNTIANISGTTITLTNPIAFNHSSGAWFRDQATVSGSTTYNSPPRDLAGAMAFVSGDRCQVKDCAAIAVVTAVKLRGEPSSNSLNDYDNAVVNLRTEGVQFGVLGQQQTRPHYSNINFVDATSGQPSAPGHGLYETGLIGPGGAWNSGTTYNIYQQVTQGTALTGTATVTQGSTAVTFSNSQSLSVNDGLIFSSQGTVYTVASGSGTSYVLQQPYTGTGSSSATIVKNPIQYISLQAGNLNNSPVSSPTFWSPQTTFGNYFGWRSKSYDLHADGIKCSPNDQNKDWSCLKDKFTDGATIDSPIVEKSVRAMDLQECNHCTVNGAVARNFIAPSNSDSSAAAITSLDCNWLTINGPNIGLAQTSTFGEVSGAIDMPVWLDRVDGTLDPLTGVVMGHDNTIQGLTAATVYDSSFTSAAVRMQTTRASVITPYINENGGQNPYLFLFASNTTAASFANAGMLVRPRTVGSTHIAQVSTGTTSGTWDIDPNLLDCTSTGACVFTDTNGVVATNRYGVNAQSVAASGPANLSTFAVNSFQRVGSAQSGNTYNLPSPATYNGTPITFECTNNGATYTYTVQTPSGAIKGGTQTGSTYTHTCTSEFGSVTFENDGTNWWALTPPNVPNLSNATGSLALGAIAQGGATTGQVLAWSGTAWAPTTAGYVQTPPAQQGFVEWNGDPAAIQGKSNAATTTQYEMKIVARTGGSISNINVYVGTAGNAMTAATTNSISGAASGTGGVYRLTVAATAPATNAVITVSGATGTGGFNPNGAWLATNVDSTHVELQGSTFTGAYTSGGTVTTSANAAAVYSSSGNFLSATGDQAGTCSGTCSGAWGSTGLKAMALATPITITSGSTYYIALVFNGTTTVTAFENFQVSPTIANVGGSGANFRWATSSTAATALQSSFTPSSNVQTTALTYFVALNQIAPGPANDNGAAIVGIGAAAIALSRRRKSAATVSRKEAA